MNKPTLILIPGLLCDDAVWQPQITTLKHHANIIIPDINHYNNADDLIESIIAISPAQFYLAGHSMGGWLALELLRKYSNRVKKLCILATSAGLDSAKKMRFRRQCINLNATMPADELAHYLAGFYAFNPKITATITAMFKRNIDALVLQQQAMIQRRSCEDILPTIHIPTAVIVGQQDKEFFNSTQYIAECIPNAVFTVVDDCGHMLTLEQPEVCTAIMQDWLLLSPTA